jgi:acyl-CoA thioesterase-1
MVDAAKAAGVNVALVSPTLVYENLQSPENVRLGRYIRAMEEVAARSGARFIDLNRIFRQVVAEYQRHAGPGVDLLTTDGVHMNPAGNKLMAWSILLGMGVPERDLAAARPQ